VKLWSVYQLVSWASIRYSISELYGELAKEIEAMYKAQLRPIKEDYKKWKLEYLHNQKQLQASLPHLFCMQGTTCIYLYFGMFAVCTESKQYGFFMFGFKGEISPHSEPVIDLPHRMQFVQLKWAYFTGKCEIRWQQQDLFSSYLSNVIDFVVHGV